LPKAPKANYKITPDLATLYRMTEAQLKAVEDFTIENEFGSIEFFGTTDLTGVDLGDIVTIEQGNCEVYDDVRHKDSKPADDHAHRWSADQAGTSQAGSQARDVDH